MGNEKHNIPALSDGERLSVDGAMHQRLDENYASLWYAVNEMRTTLGTIAAIVPATPFAAATILPPQVWNAIAAILHVLK